MTNSIASTAAETRGNTAHAIADLRRRVVGTVHTADDPTWDRARMAWSVNIDQQPLAVLEVHDTDDVQAAVRWAVDHGIDVTAQPTGHGAVSETAAGVLLLRTGALDEVSVDVQRRTAWVGAGVKAGALLAALDGTGLTFLAGSNPDPTVVGMTITGGISWFGRAFGLGADSVVTVELVDGLGRLRRLSATEEPELFWAVRGGGGSFGIITRIEVGLHAAPSLYGGRLLWPLEQMAEVLDVFRDVTLTAPRELTLWFHTYQFPPFPELPEPIRGKSFASVAAAYLGDGAEAERLLAPFRTVDGLAMDLMGELPMSALASIADEPTDPMPGMQSSHLLRELDDETAAALVAAVGPGSRSPLTIVQVRHLGAAFAEVVSDAGSHGPVTEPYSVLAIGVPAVPELVPAIQGQFARVADAVAAVDSGRKLLNFLESGQDPALWWSAETRARLAAAKQVSDPLGIVRSNRPIRP
jgi:FAD/FMN-containing dehydrogenase